MPSNTTAMILTLVITLMGWFVSVQAMHLTEPYSARLESKWPYRIAQSTVSAGTFTFAFFAANSLPGASFSLIFCFAFTFICQMLSLAFQKV